MSQVCYKTTRNGTDWEATSKVPSAYCDNGLQMTKFKGDLYAVMNATGHFEAIYTAKWQDGFGFVDFRGLDPKYKPKGRCSMTALGNRCYLCFADSDAKIHLLYTENFSSWVDAGILNWIPTFTDYPPTIGAHGDKIYVAHVGRDGKGDLHIGACDIDGKPVGILERYENLHSQEGLCMTAYQDKMMLFHVSWTKDRVYYQDFTPFGGWSRSATGINTPGIKSIMSVVEFKDKLYLAYKGPSNEIKVQYSSDRNSWTDASASLDGVYMTQANGLGASSKQMIIAWGSGEKSSEEKSVVEYQPPLFMSEKPGPAVDEELWNVKWNQHQGQKSWISKIFCW